MIAEKIIDSFTEDGEVVLCVHDSFIVPERLADSLERAMDNTFQATLFDLGIHMKVQPTEHEEYWYVRVKKTEGSGKRVIDAGKVSAWRERMDDFKEGMTAEDYYKIDDDNVD